MATRKKKSESAKPASSGHANVITQSLVEQTPAIAASCGAAAIFVYADALSGAELPSELQDRVIYVSRTADETNDGEHGPRSILVPDVSLSRLGQVKIALFLALARGIISRGDTVVFLAGVSASGTLDTIVVMQVGEEFELFRATGRDSLPAKVNPEVIERVIGIASELGTEGREGKPVGAIFVLGDCEKVLGLSRQLILNPFRGYPESQRNILDHDLEETIKELASIDGAFLVRGDGVIESCGAYLKTASQEEYELPRGLGGRHHAAAAITSVTDSIAVTISESTGSVTVFARGHIITEIEKPRSAADRRTPSEGE